MSKTKTVIKLVPPDGGWGWMVLLGSAVTNIFNQAMFSQFSLLYGDKLQEMGHRTTGAAMVLSVMLCVINFGGPFVGVLVKLKSPRFVCVTGSVICASGIFLSSFSTNIVHLSLSYGVVFGVGLGFIQNASFVAINSYFKLKKSIAVGIAMTGTGIGQAIMPHVVQYSLDKFGFSGACWLLSALCLHGVCGTLLMQPVEWHMKKIEEEVLIEEEKIEMNKCQTDIEDDQPAKMFTKDNSQLKKRSTLNGFSDDFKTGSLNKTPELKKNALERIYELFDISLLSSPRFINVIIGIGLTYISIQNFGMLFPFFLLNIGMSRNETATCMSAVALADIFGRLIVPQVQVRLKLTARLTLFLTCIWIIITRQMLAYQTDLTSILVLSALYGIGRSMVIVARNLTITEHCRVDQVPSAVGLGMLCLGIISPPIGYFLGWIRDYTEDYIACISAQNALLILFLIIWLPDMLLQYYKKKKSNAEDV
ncbi:monocarboxylate transporter 2-like [Pieris napi]|uniref:monocarboxylate transporter 2-like n=1 Tax=Pieris napi TaxID=78633 RepID=UPI001FB907F2|nr:monocarboxylate transporter 2-like [Pieris napi]XP_047510714.1 monocarboxylate transporter 2-like [Pieris napi]XP_047510722.1 monocarboxylate transporter 2-like [Pieris napi]